MEKSVKPTMGSFRLLHFLARYWWDERGTVSPMATILLTTILGLGVMVGLVSLRDQMLQQFGDVAVALRHLQQAYHYEVGVDVNRDGDVLDAEDHVFAGSFSDRVDLADFPDEAPACLDLTIAPLGEG